MNDKSIQQIIDDELNPSRDWKAAIITAGQIIYILGIIYAGAHIFSWTKATLTDFVVFGYIGAFAVVGNALVLPWAIKEWTFETKHRFAAFAFYILDIVLLAGFVWADTNLARGVQNQAITNYLTNISPITFINAIITWGTLTILDPENLEKFKLRTAFQQARRLTINTEAVVQLRQAEQQSARKLNAVGAPVPVIDYQKPETRNQKPEPAAANQNGHSPKVSRSR